MRATQTWSELLLGHLQMFVLGVSLVASSVMAAGFVIPLLITWQMEANIDVTVIGNLIVAQLVIWDYLVSEQGQMPIGRGMCMDVTANEKARVLVSEPACE